MTWLLLLSEIDVTIETPKTKKSHLSVRVLQDAKAKFREQFLKDSLEPMICEKIVRGRGKIGKQKMSPTFDGVST